MKLNWSDTIAICTLFLGNSQTIQSILADFFFKYAVCLFLFIFMFIIISSTVYVFFPSFHTGNVMMALYALGMAVSSDVY